MLLFLVSSSIPPPRNPSPFFIPHLPFLLILHPLEFKGTEKKKKKETSTPSAPNDPTTMARNVATMKDDIVVDQSALIQQYLPSKPSTSSASSPSATAMEGTENEQPDTPTAKLNRKQILLQQNIEWRKKFESMALHWQEVLCDTVSEQVLGEAVSLECFINKRQRTGGIH